MNEDIIFLEHESNARGEIHLYCDTLTNVYYIEVLTGDTELRRRFENYGAARIMYYELLREFLR